MQVLTKNAFDPLGMVTFLSTLNDTICPTDREGNCPCRFMCEPGTCTAYSSTNYVLAGLVLAGASGRHGSDGPTWSSFDTAAFSKALGLDTNPAFKDSKFTFPVGGALNQQGLSVGGSSVQYGKTELWAQDASILGWTCGNAVASAHDVARFYYQLLGPTGSILPAATVKAMQHWHTLDAGWAEGFLDYGTGLMIQNVSPLQSGGWSHRGPPPRNASASYIGHAGDTYAFQSDNGFFPAYNASISIVANQDTAAPSQFVTCQVVQIVAKHFGETIDLGCPPLPTSAKYTCQVSFGQKVCIQASFRANMTRDQCEQTCQ